MTEIRFGYTLADLDAMARAACRADRSLASDADTRYQVAWSAIAIAIVEAPHRPRRDALVRVGWQAIYDEIRQMRHTLGMARDSSDSAFGMVAGHRAQSFWYQPTAQFEDALVERLAVPAIVATLTDTERSAVVALAVHDDYAAAAGALGVKMSTLTVRLSAARRRFYRRWYAPHVPPKVKGTDRRVEAHGKAPATHCGKGHEWTPENTRWRKSQSGRDCRACERERSRNRKGAA